MGLKLGKIVSDAHRAGSKNEDKHLTNSESNSNPYGIRADSAIFSGITPFPRAAASGGANSLPSPTIAPRP
jgi:hypothetical protein